MRVSIRIRRAALALAIGAIFAIMPGRPSPAFGADAATALAQFKGAQTTALKALKLQLKAAQAVFVLNLKAFEATVKAGGASSALVQGLFSDLITLQVAMRDALEDAFNAQGGAARNALATLPGPLNGIYPRGFTPGDGGLVDQFRLQAETAVEKNVSALRKKLVKTTTVAVKDYRWTESDLSVPVGGAPTIDTIVTFSTLAATGDGRIRLGGFAGLSNGETVNVDVSGTSNPASEDVPVQSRRWTNAVDVAEGNYTIIVRQEGDTEAFGTARIGVR